MSILKRKTPPPIFSYDITKKQMVERAERLRHAEIKMQQAYTKALQEIELKFGEYDIDNATVCRLCYRFKQYL